MPIANVYNDEGGTGREVGADAAQVTQIDDFSTLCNGERVRFTTSQDVTSGSLNIYLNGLKQRVSTISIIDDQTSIIDHRRSITDDRSSIIDHRPYESF